jgi:hydroxymethylglutaryl-CoA lyase
MAALPYGIAQFDTALAGMGGCPFVPGAAGNIATEDTAYLLARLQLHTGVDYHRVGAVSRDLESYFGRSFPGRMHKLTAPS